MPFWFQKDPSELRRALAPAVSVWGHFSPAALARGRRCWRVCCGSGAGAGLGADTLLQPRARPRDRPPDQRGPNSRLLGVALVPLRGQMVKAVRGECTGPDRDWGRGKGRAPGARGPPRQRPGHAPPGSSAAEPAGTAGGGREPQAEGGTAGGGPCGRRAGGSGSASEDSVVLSKESGTGLLPPSSPWN